MKNLISLKNSTFYTSEGGKGVGGKVIEEISVYSNKKRTRIAYVLKIKRSNDKLRFELEKFDQKNTNKNKTSMIR